MPAKYIYILSDSVGTTVKEVISNVLMQFPNHHYEVKLFSFVQNETYLEKVLSEAKKVQAPVIATFVKPEIHDFAEKFAAKENLTYFNMLHPLLTFFSQDLESVPSGKPGPRHALDEYYYRRIEALEFAVTNDDGKHPQKLREADIVLLGVSRTSKTPLSLTLANLGYKVANWPIVPEVTIPKELYEIPKEKIIGLTNDPAVLKQFRRERLRSYGIEGEGLYNNDSRIDEELTYAQELYKKLDCPVINVAERSIEETATLILMIMNFA